MREDYNIWSLDGDELVADDWTESPHLALEIFDFLVSDGHAPVCNVYPVRILEDGTENTDTFGPLVRLSRDELAARAGAQ